MASGVKAVSEIELSVVIPVYNGSQTIQSVVDAAHAALATVRFEVVLVNDGSHDSSQSVCARLAARYPHTVSFIELARNFGEHAALLAGLRRTSGDYVATMDDDGQNPPDQLLILLDEIRHVGRDEKLVDQRPTANRSSPESEANRGWRVHAPHTVARIMQDSSTIR